MNLLKKKNETSESELQKSNQRCSAVTAKAEQVSRHLENIFSTRNKFRSAEHRRLLNQSRLVDCLIIFILTKYLLTVSTHRYRNCSCIISYIHLIYIHTHILTFVCYIHTHTYVRATYIHTCIEDCAMIEYLLCEQGSDALQEPNPISHAIESTAEREAGANHL